MSRDNDRQRKESPSMELSRDNVQKKCVYNKRKAAPKSIFNFHSQSKLQLPAFDLVHLWLTTLLLPWTS